MEFSSFLNDVSIEIFIIVKNVNSILYFTFSIFHIFKKRNKFIIQKGETQLFINILIEFKHFNERQLVAKKKMFHERKIK